MKGRRKGKLFFLNIFNVNCHCNLYWSGQKNFCARVIFSHITIMNIYIIYVNAIILTQWQHSRLRWEKIGSSKGNVNISFMSKNVHKAYLGTYMQKLADQPSGFPPWASSSWCHSSSPVKPRPCVALCSLCSTRARS